MLGHITEIQGTQLQSREIGRRGDVNADKLGGRRQWRRKAAKTDGRTLIESMGCLCWRLTSHPVTKYVQSSWKSHQWQVFPAKVPKSSKPIQYQIMGLQTSLLMYHDTNTSQKRTPYRCHRDRHERECRNYAGRTSSKLWSNLQDKTSLVLLFSHDSEFYEHWKSHIRNTYVLDYVWIRIGIWILQTSIHASQNLLSWISAKCNPTWASLPVHEEFSLIDVGLPGWSLMWPGSMYENASSQICIPVSPSLSP